MVILSIKDIALEFAQKYGLNTWDWIAISLTFATFVISSVSLYIACKTLKSQRKTEQNTLPVINKEIQLFLLEQFVIRIFHTYYYTLALKFQYSNKKQSLYISHHFEDIIPDINEYFHESIFYGNGKKYETFKSLQSDCESFIRGFKFLYSNIQAKSETLIESEFFLLLSSFKRIPKQVYAVLDICFNLDNSHIDAIFDRIITQTPISYPDFFPKNMGFYEPICVNDKLVSKYKALIKQHEISKEIDQSAYIMTFFRAGYDGFSLRNADIVYNHVAGILATTLTFNEDNTWQEPDDSHQYISYYIIEK